jgi:ParB-like chromosome segregation protein Spo0J
MKPTRPNAPEPVRSRARSPRGVPPVPGRPPEDSVPPSGRQEIDRIAPSLRPLIVPLSSVETHPRNPRVGDVEAVAASLRRFGQQKPVVVQKSTGWVVAGNHVLLAARSLGWTEIAANVVELDDAMATAFMLADNRTSDLGGYDDALLAAILAQQAAADNLAGTGYDADDVAAIVAAAGLHELRDVDACPDLPAPAEVYVRPGDLYELGRHRLLVGDATREADVRRLLGDASVDLLVTDPPYGVAYTGKTLKGSIIRIRPPGDTHGSGRRARPAARQASESPSGPAVFGHRPERPS